MDKEVLTIIADMGNTVSSMIDDVMESEYLEATKERKDLITTLSNVWNGLKNAQDIMQSIGIEHI